MKKVLDIIAHRGFWLESNQKNSIEAFKLALNNGFGIETDLRDFNGKIVISHDVPNKSCISFDEFMAIIQEYPPQTLSLNIKSDGLQKLAKEVLGSYKEYFFFDMSVPDTLGYSRSQLIFYTRYSDIELHPALLSESSGVWLDNFSSNKLDIDSLERFLNLNKNVVLVSPELHGFDYESYWNQLLKHLKLNPDKIQYIGLCTDKPMDAKEFFSYAE
jgi:glycerophosphoryl diester phosphodiesterase